ncbi:MAG: hypothetical protein F6K35_25420 [Okeania sp. SIO2H7]|nr:hypothetical protein [Okeania sp. SIO2H7]
MDEDENFFYTELSAFDITIPPDVCVGLLIDHLISVLLKRVYDINPNYLGVNPPACPSQVG